MFGLVMLLGVLMLSVGVLTLVMPLAAEGFLRRNAERPVVYVGAIVGRLLIGAVLVIASDQARHPLLMEWLGWVLFVSALALIGVGRARFTRLVFWLLDRGHLIARAGGLAAVLLGGYLIGAT